MTRLLKSLALSLQLTLAGLALHAQTPTPTSTAAPFAIAEPTASASPTARDEHHGSATINVDMDLDKLVSKALDRAKDNPHESTSIIVASLIPILVPVAFFAMIIGIVWLGISSRAKQRQLAHETIRLMIEKGQPVPPELFLDPKVVRPRSDLRRGVVLTAIGVGIVAYLLSDHDSDWGLGLIPLLIGVGYLIIWKMQNGPTGSNRS
jgi:hypothetical protein